MEDRTKYKPKNKIRIAKSYKCGLISKSNNKTIVEEEEEITKPKFK